MDCKTWTSIFYFDVYCKLWTLVQKYGRRYKEKCGEIFIGFNHKLESYINMKFADGLDGTSPKARHLTILISENNSKEKVNPEQLAC